MSHDLFTTLSRYNLSSPENYLTEAFCYVVRLLLEREPTIGLHVLQRLCGFGAPGGLGLPETIQVSTQVTVEVGRPDIEIRDGAGTTLVYVEVKHGSPLSPGQLEAYQQELDRTGLAHTVLVLLTRSRSAALDTTLSPDLYHHVCWYEVYDWLAQAAYTDEASAFLTTEFRRFLEEQEMSQTQVTWDYIRGVPAMLHLTDMLEAALQEAIPGVTLRKTGGWNWRGFRLPGDLWCGLRYGTPLAIAFEDGNGYSPTYRRALDLQDAHFFAMDKNAQYECLVGFLRQAFDGVPRGVEKVEMLDGNGSVDEEE